MLTVITYDISDDKRRNDVSSELENYGMRVQKSVFECYLNDEQLNDLKTTIENMIDITTDNIRYYFLCKKDYRKVVIDGIETVYRNDDYFMI